MAVAVWGDLIRVTHDLILALRAIERSLIDPTATVALAKANSIELSSILESIRTGDIAGVRQKLRSLEIRRLEDLSMKDLRHRASCLRIPRYTDMSKGVLIHEIKKIEAVVASRVALMTFKKPAEGFCNGDGI